MNITILWVLAFVPSTATLDVLTGQVVAVSDGDSLTLLVDGARYPLDLAGIDTPEPNQDWGDRAARALAAKVLEQKVRVNIIATNQFGVLVGTIWLGNRDINRELVREGHAWVNGRTPADHGLREDELAARSEGIGLWSLASPIPPWDWHPAQAVPGG